jgi:hypothetical protein
LARWSFFSFFSLLRDFYELHFLLFSLKHGGINFEHFLKRAKAWAEDEPQPFDRPLF